MSAIRLFGLRCLSGHRALSRPLSGRSDINNAGSIGIDKADIFKNGEIAAKNVIFAITSFLDVFIIK